ncbi:hypothetical protein [Spiroplasma endosymbiont of Atherix ibis]|uniref:hypothetical protein n=1 Tax=Spiroplasma endosymbiont of Atherix ibis TaxID=3066291 RepID=UPI0030D2476B
MFKYLIKNPKRIVRNLTIILIGFVVALLLFTGIAFFFESKIKSIPLFVIVGATGIGLLIAIFLTIAILGYFANIRDAGLRRRYQSEVNSIDTSKIAEANGIINPEIINTTRNAKDIKKELVNLQVELYHAQERDKNLKLAKKF